MTDSFTASRAPEVIAALRPTFGNRLLTGRAAREQHGSAESWLPAALPDAVVMVQSSDEVARVLATCNLHRVPVIPFGAGSSLEGQIIAIDGGISLDLSGMNRILAVNAADMDCRVECGVTRQRLNDELRATGLFFPVDLGAHATLGGMAATSASGTTTVRYGSMRDLVMGLTVALPDGRIVRTGGRARKSASGYDLMHLFVGSEGTLGVITDLTLRLHGQPALRQSLLASFPDLESAADTVVAALQIGLGMNRIELADALQMTAINRYAKTDLPETPTLWVELVGSEISVPHDLSLFEKLAQDSGAVRIQRADTAEAANRLWRIRHDALYAARALRPGIKGISTDVCVPVSCLPDCIGRIQRVIAATGLKAPLIGHVGDGNFHLVLLFDPADAGEMAAARRINGTLVELALSMGGTTTGEHGVGLGKKAYMAAEHGPALDLMRTIKRAIDPANIMNPGKIFDLIQKGHPMTDEVTTPAAGRLVRPEIARLPDYNAGLALERFRAIYGLDAHAKLDSNENPLGPSPDAIAAIGRAAATVARYPDAANTALRAAIAAATGMAAEQVIIGNGSEDLIGAIFRTVLRPGDHVVTVCPSFGLHEFGALACGATVEKVRFDADWRFPLAALGAALAGPTRALILSSPSNPAGPAIAADELRHLLAATPEDTLVIFDEAYREYVAPEARVDAVPVLTGAGRPWIILRTFSKAYGLAGLRVGYGISSDTGLIRALMKSRNPFGVNALAGTAAMAAFADVAHLAKVTSLARAERARVAEALEAKGYPVAPSQANFLFFDTGGAASDLAEGLRRKGVLIKAWQEEPFRNWARVTMGTTAENDAFVAALPELARPKADPRRPR